MSGSKEYQIGLTPDEVNLIKKVLQRYLDFYNLFVDDPDYNAEERKDIQQEIDATENLIEKLSSYSETGGESMDVEFSEDELKYLIICLSEDKHSRAEKNFLEKSDAERERKKEEVVVEYGLVEKLKNIVG